MVILFSHRGDGTTGAEEAICPSTFSFKVPLEGKMYLYTITLEMRPFRGMQVPLV